MSVNEFISTAFTQKAIYDGLQPLRACRRHVNRSLWMAWSAASAAKVIETDLLPALEAFLATVDRANSVVDDRIAQGEWQSHAFLAVARDRLETYRVARDKLSVLVKRAAAGEATRRELMAELRSMPR